MCYEDVTEKQFIWLLMDVSTHTYKQTMLKFSKMSFPCVENNAKLVLNERIKTMMACIS